MSLIETASSNSEPPQEQPQKPSEGTNAEEEVPFQPTDPFWKDTTFHGSDAQLVVAVTLHVGHEIAHEVKGIIKDLLGLR